MLNLTVIGKRFPGSTSALHNLAELQNRAPIIQRETNLLIIGGGPAGYKAALTLGRLGKDAGIKILLVDGGIIPGGQLTKQTHKFFGCEKGVAGVRGFQVAENLLNQIKSLPNIEILNGTSVYGITPDQVFYAISKDNTRHEIKTDYVLMATGAGEKTLIFPGNHLPGVMGAGAAQTMMNVHRVLPGKKVLMVGGGNIGLIVAYQMLQAGAEKITLVEAMPHVGGYDVHLRKILRDPRIEVSTSHSIVKALGAKNVEGAIIRKIDNNFQPIAGTEKDIDVDLICMAVGLDPDLRLARQLGIEITAKPRLGEIPVMSGVFETSIPNIFVAGDAAGIGEATIAMKQGEIAAYEFAYRLGLIGKEDTVKYQNVLTKDLEVLSFAPDHPQPPTQTKLIDGITIPDFWPSEERMKAGPFTISECFQQIPCSPCVNACNKQAINIDGSITNLPEINYKNCTGCKICLSQCPGLALFVIDWEKGRVSFPCEMQLPEKGQSVWAIDNMGEDVCIANIFNVTSYKNNKTAIITLEVGKENLPVVRNFRFLDKDVITANPATSHPILPPLENFDVVPVFVNDAEILLRTGIPIASALWEQGIKMLNLSSDHHLASGIFCAIGQCSSCTVEILRSGNSVWEKVKACDTPAEKGISIRINPDGLDVGGIDEKDSVLCRCQEVLMSDIEKSESDSSRDISRKTKAGTGSCGGKTCGPHIRKLTAADAGTFRSPAGMVPFELKKEKVDNG